MRTSVPFDDAGVARTPLAGLAGRLAILLALVLLPLPAASPLFASGLHITHDGVLHLHRAVELFRCLQDGNWYPRWAPDLAQGLGYPIFNFYAPLASYIQVAFHSIGLTYVDSFKATLALGLFLCGAGMYLLARQSFARPASLLAAAAFAYAPYQMVEVYARGALSELLAFALLPVVLWSLQRVVSRPSLGSVALGALCYALLMVSHSLGAFFASAIIGLYALVEIGRARSLRPLPWIVAVVGLGLAASAFYWLPAIGEKEWVHIERTVMPPIHDFHYQLIAFQQFLDFQGPLDVRQGNTGRNLVFGRAQLMLAAFGLLAVALRRLPRATSYRAVFFAAVGLLLMYLLTPPSAPFWETVPLVGFIQFPWRLLGPISLCLAFLVGAAPGIVPRNGRHTELAMRALITTAVALLLLQSFFYLYPSQREDIAENPTIADIQAHERFSGTVGTNSVGEYLPMWVEWLPDTPADGTCSTCQAREWLVRSAMPPDVDIQMELLAHRTNYESYGFASSEPVTLLFGQVYYPAWHAYVDGQEIEVRPFLQHGLGWITLTVPAGTHTVELRFEDTALARVGNWTSGLSIVILVGLIAVGRVRARRTTAVSATVAGHEREAWTWVALLGMVLIAKVGYVDRHTDWFRIVSPPGVALAAENQLVANFADKMLCLGYTLQPGPARAGETVKVTLFWEPLQRPALDYASFVALVPRVTAPPVARADGLYARMVPTTTWQTGLFYVEGLELRLPPDLAPGEYVLIFGLYDPEPGGPELAVSGAQPERTYEVLDRLTVVP